MIQQCCTEVRRAAILGNPNVNGIDYLEVLDRDAVPLNSPRQQTLLVHCLRPPPPNLTTANVVVDGGESIIGITALWLAPATALPPQASALEKAYFQALPAASNVLVIRTDKAGDFSTYTLRLVNNAAEAAQDPFAITEALAGFDPQLAQAEFSFKIECGPDFDCVPAPADCPPILPTPPPINYLAKDYGSFRSILLDRLNQLLPDWGASSDADLGIALAELLAYVGDRLSYQQDAIATEAYLQTARSRVSLRRHALLVDYHVHDGCNARAWVQLQVAAQVFMARDQTRFFTIVPGAPATLAIGAGNEEAALLAGVIVFEPMQDAMLYPEHNQMAFYTWGDADCCLPAGTTEATLAGSYPNLQPGDVLIFQEVIGPQTGIAADADIRHRCAVRLTQVATKGGLGGPLADPLFQLSGEAITAPAVQPAVTVTEIAWAAADALPFPVCLSSSFIDSTGTKRSVSDVSIVLGNVVLADHGLSFTNIDLGTVPGPSIFYPPNPAADRCQPTAPTPLPVRFRPQIPDAPITQAVPLALAGSPVTPSAVMLGTTGLTALTDSARTTCLLVQANNPFGWPQFFAARGRKNADPAKFDLDILYAPQGTASSVVLETHAGLTFVPADPNYCVTRLKTSRLVTVPAGYAPPLNVAGYTGAVVNLSNTGPIILEDSGAQPFLTLQPTNPASWPANFGIIAQGNQQNVSLFNLVVVYNPPTGGIGVNLPVTVEQFSQISLANVAEEISAAAQLIAVKSFAQAPNASLSAAELMEMDPNTAIPQISLIGALNDVATAWTCRQDLLEDNAASPDFVMEVEANGVATLRFGDGVNGKQVETGTVFSASYRVGNGTAGNLGAGSLVGLAAGDARITAATNPLPATGGTDPETNEQIRRRAPQNFLTQERAVTMVDYETLASASSTLIGESVATMRWTGSWYTAFVAAEPRAGGDLSPALQRTLKKNLQRYRLAGQDLEVRSPQYLSLEIELQICVDPAYFQRNVQQSLLAALSALFAPANLSFGQPVYLSPIYAAARRVAGVTSVAASVFQPQGINSAKYLLAGQIIPGPFQVARLENNPSFPNHGRLSLVMEGGK